MSICLICFFVRRHSISMKMMKPSEWKSLLAVAHHHQIYLIKLNFIVQFFFFSLQLHNILIAIAICAQWRFVGASSTRCTVTMHVAVTKEFKCWHIHCQIFINVSGTGYRPGWPLFIATEQFWYWTKWLVSHNTRWCGRYTKINIIHELLGILQCSRTSCTPADQTAVAGFYVSRIHCTNSWSSFTSGRNFNNNNNNPKKVLEL